jgi:hypothetical protein
MRVLFVQPPFVANRIASAFGIAEPLAYEILASTIPHHNVKIFDMRLEKGSLVREIEIFNPNVVGVGCVTAGY